jgi:hypothetical protein
MWARHATRNPTLLLRLFGSFLLRNAARAFSGLSFQEPPRTTRRLVSGSPAGRNRHPYCAIAKAICQKNRGGASAPPLAAHAANQ